MGITSGLMGEIRAKGSFDGGRSDVVDLLRWIVAGVVFGSLNWVVSGDW